jgi:peroxiredoxin
MADRTERLTVGSVAPEFSLAAANHEGDFSLSALRAHGAVILEFLRGTW